ncbi:helix-turn-helix domain-containing protein [Enteractinococcus coprophilus]|nr:helix-turn-helix domain-containing protein [Enteractinococcus coprophilus]
MHNDHRQAVSANNVFSQGGNITTGASWQTIVQRVADDLESIVEEFLTELHGRGVYEDGQVESTDLRHTAIETFRYLLDRIMGKPLTEHQQHAARRLGVRRARQKVQIEDLMAAIRLDFVVLWRRIRATMAPDELPVLVDHTETMLTTIERYIREVQLEFLAETARIARDARLATERHMARLLNTSQLTPASLEVIAQGLSVQVNAEFEVVVINESAVLEVQEALAEPLAAGKILGYPYRSGYCLIQQRTSHGASLVRLSHNYAGAYVPRTTGLEAVPNAVAALTRLLEYQPELNELVSIETLWPTAISDTLSSLLPGFPDSFLAGLKHLPPGELDDVITTISQFLETGSIKDTAVRVDRHRNTVINRLRSFEAATGLDVKIPRDAVLAALVLASPKMQMHN